MRSRGGGEGSSLPITFRLGSGRPFSLLLREKGEKGKEEDALNLMNIPCISPTRQNKEEAKDICTYPRISGKTTLDLFLFTKKIKKKKRREEGLERIPPTILSVEKGV